jgi:hypothetical protein
MYVYTIYTRPLSVQAQYSRKCPIIRSSCYNISLVTWTAVCLTAAKFNLIIFHYPNSQSQSQSHIATDGQSVCLSWCRSPSGAHDQILITVWQLLSCPWEGAISDERTGLSFVSQPAVLGQLSVCTIFYILHVSHVTEYIYNICKASVSPGSVQQIMPYFW